MKLKKLLHSFIRKIMRKRVLLKLEFEKQKLNRRYIGCNIHFDVISDSCIAIIIQELCEEYDCDIKKCVYQMMEYVPLHLNVIKKIGLSFY